MDGWMNVYQNSYCLFAFESIVPSFSVCSCELVTCAVTWANRQTPMVNTKYYRNFDNINHIEDECKWKFSTMKAINLIFNLVYRSDERHHQQTSSSIIVIVAPSHYRTHRITLSIFQCDFVNVIKIIFDIRSNNCEALAHFLCRIPAPTGVWVCVCVWVFATIPIICLFVCLFIFKMYRNYLVCHCGIVNMAVMKDPTLRKAIINYDDVHRTRLPSINFWH